MSDPVWQTLATLCRARRRAGDLAGAQRAAQRTLGRRFQHAGGAESDARQLGAAVASARCVPGAARLSASAVGQIPQHRRQRAVGCVHRLVALETGRFGRGREHRHPLQQWATGAVGAQRRQRSRAGIHHSDFRRSHRCRPVEPAGRRRRTVAVCDALQRNAVLPGRQRRGATELYRRRIRRRCACPRTNGN